MRGRWTTLTPLTLTFFVSACAVGVYAAEPGRSRTCEGPFGLPCHYALTSWPTVHRDSRNSDYTPFVAPIDNRVMWTALDGAAVLLAPTLGPEGHAYVTTGRGPGTSHLHAFDRDGSLLWESEPQIDLDDLDSRAVGSAPLIDRSGDVYLSDANQFWAFHPDGSVKWVRWFPEGSGGFVSAIITKEGHVGGVTTNGVVLVFHASDGSSAAEPFELPGGAGPEAPPHIPGLWADGLIDPEIVTDIEKTLFGFEFEVVNTPAIHPATGRLYINGAGNTPDVGAMYGLDLIDGAWHIAFATEIAGGSGSSPAISPDGRVVYAASGRQRMTAFDAETGEVLWTRLGSEATASPAVGPDGTIYAGSGAAHIPGLLTALNPDGSIKWQQTYDDLAQALLPELRPAPRSVPNGVPTAKTGGVVSISAQRVWVVLTLGYNLETPNLRTHLPHLVALVSIDPADGALLGYTLLRDTSEGLISISTDGRIYVSHAAFLSSIVYNWINRIVPLRFRIDGPPIAGISALEPISTTAYAVDAIDWMQSQLERLQHGDVLHKATSSDDVLVTTKAQIDAIIDALSGSSQHERTEAAEAIAHLHLASRHLEIAVAVVPPKGLFPVGRRFDQAILDAIDELSAARIAMP